MAVPRIPTFAPVVLGGVVVIVGGVFMFSSSETFIAEISPSGSSHAEARDIAPREPNRLIEERRATGDLLPDFVPLPPRDMNVITHDTTGQLLLRFSTTYYNQGDGPVELRADPATAGIRADIDRNVFQRVYRSGGSHRDKLVGNFLWHQEHLHYHFADFVEYDLVSVDEPDHPDLSGTLVKSTFCIRDVSRIEMELPNRVTDASYLICGKELQGVSVGWGDTYFFDYPDQALDVSDLASGVYRLSFDVNPERRLDELRYNNNRASALFRLDVDARTVEVLEEFPSVNPPIEHVHLEQPFGNVPR